jgi:acetyltransferase-like isoleucine patch superfamily enzyme
MPFEGDRIVEQTSNAVYPTARVGRGTSIGARCKIETNAYITAITTIGDDCFVAPEVTFTNDDFLGRSEKRFEHHGGPILETGARVGANSTVLPGRRIARDGLVAAGAVVTRDVPARTLVMGIPAAVRGPVPEDELLENQLGWR